MASVIERLLYLRKVMQSMEADLGLQDLSQIERDIVYAAHDSADTGGEFEASSVLDHALTRDIPKTTYHRAFKALLDRRLIEPAKGFKTHRCVLRSLR